MARYVSTSQKSSLSLLSGLVPLYETTVIIIPLQQELNTESYCMLLFL